VTLYEAGERPIQETRHWDEEAGRTRPGRSKEEAEDYRYFPEPDLVPIAPEPAWVEQLRATLPEPPAQRRRRLQADWGFADLEMRDLVNAGALDAVEATIAAGAGPAAARKWWTGELARQANARGVAVEELPITPQAVAELAALVDGGTLTDTLARQVVEHVLAGEGAPSQVVAARNLRVVSDDGALLVAVDAAIEANPEVAEKVRGGKDAAIGALVGAVMKQMRGQADEKRVRELLAQRLGGPAG
jgi:aspartyl-tRNA(Asn)/glutamyl-tRNA(Gln) amidotransferase subunit B